MYKLKVFIIHLLGFKTKEEYIREFPFHIRKDIAINEEKKLIKLFQKDQIYNPLKPYKMDFLLRILTN